MTSTGRDRLSGISATPDFAERRRTSSGNAEDSVSSGDEMTEDGTTGVKKNQDLLQRELSVLAESVASGNRDTTIGEKTHLITKDCLNNNIDNLRNGEKLGCPLAGVTVGKKADDQIVDGFRTNGDKGIRSKHVSAMLYHESESDSKETVL